MEEPWCYRFLETKYGPELLIDLYRKENDWGLGISHQLDYYEICLISHGSGTIYTDFEPIPIEAGRVVFTPPGPVRKWLVEGEFEARFLIFKGTFINTFFNDALFLHKMRFFHQSGSRSLCAEPETFDGFVADFEEMFGEIDHLQEDSAHLLRAMLYRMLIHLNRLYGKVYHLNGEQSGLVLVERLRSLIDQHFQNQRRVDAYAEMLHISPGHLNDKIRRHTGLSVSELIRNRVLAEARRLLLHTENNVAEIAEILCFRDPSYFVRYFRKSVGCTPRRYRTKTASFYHSPPNNLPYGGPDTTINVIRSQE